MREKQLKIFSLPIFLILLLFLTACTQSAVYDPNVSVPSGDPAFPPGRQYGVIDPYYYLNKSSVSNSLVIIDGLKKDGLAEIVVLIQEKVKHPEEYATHYGRYIGLGEKEKNNGLVWLIRPDVRPEENRITYSIGRGLPRLTSSDLVEVMLEAAPLINTGDFNDGVLTLVKGTDQKIREIYKRR